MGTLGLVAEGGAGSKSGFELGQSILKMRLPAVLGYGRV